MIRRGEASEYFGHVAGASSDALIQVNNNNNNNNNNSNTNEIPTMAAGETALVSLTQPNLAMVPLANQRTSRLRDTNYQLVGHQGAVLSAAFDPSGQALASGSVDNNICKLIYPALFIDALLVCLLVFFYVMCCVV